MIEILQIIQLAFALLFLRGAWLLVREGFRHDYRPEKWSEAAERRGGIEVGVGLFVSGACQILLEALR